MEGDTNINFSDSCDASTLQCKPNSCILDEDQYKFECCECHRHVHYRCTQLPSYQIQQFLISGYRRYKCISCVDTAKYITELMPSPSIYKTMKELTRALQQSNEENDSLTYMNTQLQAEIDKKSDNGEITKLKSDIKAYEN